MRLTPKVFHAHSFQIRYAKQKSCVKVTLIVSMTMTTTTMEKSHIPHTCAPHIHNSTIRKTTHTLILHGVLIWIMKFNKSLYFFLLRFKVGFVVRNTREFLEILSKQHRSFSFGSFIIFSWNDFFFCFEELSQFTNK